MTDTPNLALPCIQAAQAQKHVTHNEALRLLDTLVQLAVLDRDLAAPPGSPAEGARWIVAASPSGAWAGHAGHVAAWQDGAWQFSAPKLGWLAYVVDEGTLVTWNGSAWSDFFATVTALQNLSRLGIGTSADATNPFSAKLNNVLMLAKTAAEGGDGDLRCKLSKETAGDTASILFQDNLSGRAEIGLTGDDDLHLKVSADGAAWTEALRLDKNTGAATLPHSLTVNESVNHAFVLRARPDVGVTFPVPFVQPTKANSVIALDVMPKGTPSELAGNGFAWTDICDADLLADPSAATRVARVAIASTGARFGSIHFGAASAPPVEFIVGGAIQGRMTGAFKFQMGSATATPQGNFDATDGTVHCILNQNGTVGQVGTFSNHPLSVIVNNTEVGRFGAALAEIKTPVKFSDPSINAGYLVTDSSGNLDADPCLSLATLVGVLRAADFNSTADQAIALNLRGATRYRLNTIVIQNPSASCSGAVGGMYTAPAKAGTAVVAASQTYTGLLVPDDLAIPSIVNVAAKTLTASTLYFSLSTPKGGTATADIFIYAILFT